MKVSDIVKKLNYDEIEVLISDLQSGGIEFKKEVSDRLENLKEKEHCAICHKELSKEDSTFSLVFGPGKMKMKTTFCEVDCLLNFISRLKHVKDDKTFSDSINKLKHVDDLNKAPEQSKPSIPKFSFEYQN